ncbi:MAG TPA: hypothetical protein VM240_09540 [Verrucomicrobiae bacterium]|nr:hypothetical protein [Verrucomicrobiae bacterium]
MHELARVVLQVSSEVCELLTVLGVTLMVTVGGDCRDTDGLTVSVAELLAVTPPVPVQVSV